MYLLYVVLFLAVCFTAWKLSLYFIKQWKLKNLRKNWGKLADRPIDVEAAEQFFKMQDLKETDRNYVIDDDTWKDLNMDDLFQIMDRNVTPIGSQWLYSMLRQPLLNKDDIEKRGELIEYLRNNAALREELQLILLNISSPYAKFLRYALWKDLPEKPVYSMIFSFLSFMATAILILCAFGKIHFGFIIAIFVINIIAKSFGRGERNKFLAAFQYLPILVETADKLKSVKNIVLEDIQKDISLWLKDTKKIASKIFAMQFSDNDIVMTYVNLYFLFDIVGFYSQLNKIKLYLPNFKRLFETVGYVDSLISAASFKQGLSYYCKPEFTEDKNRFVMEKLYHPLIINPVSNDFSFLNKNVIVTGSNMAGKSTFLKTIGINAIMAQTLNLTTSEKYVSPIIKVMSSIERNEDLITGKSYYLAEVESILRIINSSGNSDIHLFIIDEIFRGTNSIERTAASIGVLKYLKSEKDFVLIATHDLQLTEEVNEIYKNYHFTEEMREDGLYFDYKLYDGVSKSRNAIALLDFVGYPKTIIETAKNNINHS